MLTKRAESEDAMVRDAAKSKDMLADSRFELNQSRLAEGHLSLGDIDNAFASLQAGILDHNRFLLDSLIVAEW